MSERSKMITLIVAAILVAATIQIVLLHTHAGKVLTADLAGWIYWAHDICKNIIAEMASATRH